MFTTTNVAATSASTGGVGPVAAAVQPTFQILGASVGGSSASSASSSSSSSANSSTIQSGPWRLAPMSSSTFMRQPTIVSIINGNVNVSSSSSTSVPFNPAGLTIPGHSNMICISTANPHQYHPINTGNLLLHSSPTVRLVPTTLHSSSSTPTLTFLNNGNLTINSSPRQMTTTPVSSSSLHFKPGICIDTPALGLLAPITIHQQILNQTSPPTCPPVISATPTAVQMNSSNGTGEVNDNDLIDNSQDQEIEIVVNNVVASFALGCKLDLRKIAKEAPHVIHKRDQAMVLMKIRKPQCSANLWSSGKVTVTGATSEDDARRGARAIARSIQRLGFKVRFLHYRVVNCLATCSMPWPIDIVKLSRTYPELVSYEPEIHPGATVRLPNNAVLKVFTTGSVTLTAPCVDRINSAVNEFYPQLFECRKIHRNGGQC